MSVATLALGIFLLVLSCVGIAGIVLLVVLISRIASEKNYMPSSRSSHHPISPCCPHRLHFPAIMGDDGAHKKIINERENRFDIMHDRRRPPPETVIHDMRTREGTYGRFRIATQDLRRLQDAMYGFDANKFRITSVREAGDDASASYYHSDKDRENARVARREWIARLNADTPEFSIDHIFVGGSTDEYKWIQLDKRAYYFPRDLLITVLVSAPSHHHPPYYIS